jgi:lipopolysaccharide transport system permease protein
LAIISGVLYTHFPDTNHILEICVQILFYLTPIMYKEETFESRGRIIAVVEWNPLTSILALMRTPILNGTAPALHNVWISVVFVAVLATVAVILLRRVERNLIFWI